MGKIINYGAIIDILIAFSLFWPLYQLFGLPGLAFSIIVATFIQPAYYLFKTKKLMMVNVIDLIPWKNWLMKITFYFILLYALKRLTLQFHSPLKMLIVSGIVVAVISLIIFFIEMKATKIKSTAPHS